jgi:hypothetical protein
MVEEILVYNVQNVLFLACLQQKKKEEIKSRKRCFIASFFFVNNQRRKKIYRILEGMKNK